MCPSGAVDLAMSAKGFEVQWNIYEIDLHSHVPGALFSTWIEGCAVQVLRSIWKSNLINPCLLNMGFFESIYAQSQGGTEVILYVFNLPLIGLHYFGLDRRWDKSLKTQLVYN